MKTRKASHEGEQLPTHDELIASLAQHLYNPSDRLYRELRSAAWQTLALPIPDLVQMGRFQYGQTTWKLVVYEVKASRSDLLQDLRSAKWRRYVDDLGAQRVVFAGVKDVVCVSDVPRECGVMALDPANGRWSVRRSGVKLQTSIDRVNQKLLIAMMDNEPWKPFEATERTHRIRDVVRYAPREGDPPEAWEAYAQKVGHRFAAVARHINANNANVRRLEEWAEKVIDALAIALDLSAEELKRTITRPNRVEDFDLSWLADTIKRAVVFKQQAQLVRDSLDYVEAVLDGAQRYAFDQMEQKMRGRIAAGPPLLNRSAAS